MKTIRSFGGLLFVMVIGMFILTQCNKEPAPEANAKFTLKNVDPDDISISQSVTVVFEMDPVKSEQHLVLYSGEPRNSYDSLKHDTTHSVSGKSIDGNVYEDLVYSQTGTFKLTAVATTYGDWNEDINQDVYSITVTVTDGRTKMSSFAFNDYNAEGSIVNDSVIYVDIIETAPFDSLVATFSLVSDSARAYVGNTLQESGVTANDFTSNVTYTVKAADGTSKDYVVEVDTLAASNNNNLSIVFSDYPDQTIIFENDTFSIRLPWGASSSQIVNYDIQEDASIMFNGEAVTGGTKTIDVSDSNVVDVIAQNLDTARYYISVDFDAYPVTSFSFKDINPTEEATIDHNNYTITYPVVYTVDTSSMVAYYEASEAATVQVQLNDSTAVEQVSGESINSFSDTVTYNFIGNNADTAQYDVIVNVFGP